MDVLKGIKKIEDLALDGRRVLMRVDLDCPLAPDGLLADESKIYAALPAIRHAKEQGARVVLASHLGNPGGKRDPACSMEPVGMRLAEILDQEVFLPEDSVGDGPRKVVMERVEGEVVLLENLRFQPEEEANDEVFAQKLAQLGDAFVNEAPSVAHLRHASTVAVARHFSEKAAGPLLTREMTFLAKIQGTPESPFVLLLGGARLSDKLALLNQLMGKVKAVAVGGAVAATLLAAKGVKVGLTPVEPERYELANAFLSRAKLRGVDVLLPTDVVVLRQGADDGDSEVVPVGQVPPDAAIVDIGPETVAMFGARMASARSVFWNGTLGMVEHKAFLAGTEAVAKALIRSSALSVVGGTDTAAAINKLVLTPFFSHVSTGGEAGLALLEGRELPAVEALRDVG